MGGVPAAAGDLEDSSSKSPRLSVVQPASVDAEEFVATIIEFAKGRAGATELDSIIYAW